MENNIYDLAILGAGPAGICAAIYATRARLNTIWLDRKFVQGGQIVDTYEVDNYPGLPGITGLDLGEAMAGHAEKLGLKPKREPVLSVTDEGEIKVIRTKKNEYHARAVIIACGATHRHLGIPGEEELGGMGVSYCATCDAAFFQEGTVAVVGGGNVAVEDAILLSRTCKKVYLVHRRDELRAAKSIQEKAFKNPKLHFMWDTVVEEVGGDGILSEMTVKNVKTGELTKIVADEEDGMFGVFGFIGTLPSTKIFEGKGLELDERGYIPTDDNMKTNIPGVFAAGDVRVKSLRQVVTAAADGAIATTQCEKYINEME